MATNWKAVEPATRVFEWEDEDSGLTWRLELRTNASPPNTRQIVLLKDGLAQGAGITVPDVPFMDKMFQEVADAIT